MRNVMSWIKVISVNIFLTLALLGLLLLTPPIAYYGYQLVKGVNPITQKDLRAELKLYDKYPWVHRHFQEFRDLSATYYDYITWRRDDYEGKTINIRNGIRHTINADAIDGTQEEYWFFGGSTTWGAGVNDEYTYPSLFAQNTPYRVSNFGEAAYIARQSAAFLLNYLVSNEITDMSSVNVVFYSGVNDVSGRCRSENSVLGSAREDQIQKTLSQGSDFKYGFERYGFERTFSQLIDLLEGIIRRISNSNPSNLNKISVYSCAENPNKALEVARTLVDTWQVTSDIVQSRGGKFTAILQPVAFYGSPETSYLKLTTQNDLDLAAQYNAVYPLIIEAVKNRNLDFLDLTNVYDGCSNCYIDFCHVGPQGHQILTTRLISDLNE